MQQFATPHAMRNQIKELAESAGLREGCYAKMLDYTIELFDSQGLGSDYYGYHNINHELEVTYGTLLVGKHYLGRGELTLEEIKYLFTAALFHDFDPQKSVDKPHEESVINFIAMDRNLRQLLDAAGIDIDIIKVLILRTTYPWRGKVMEDAQGLITECFGLSPATRHDQERQARIMRLGWFLSIIDRICGYALGDFAKSMEMAKMNAHASAWHPAVIVRRSVAFFEDLLNSEAEMSQYVLKALPKNMRRNFFNTVQSFMNLRQQEIRIQAEYIFEHLKLVPTIEKMNARNDPEFIKALLAIYDELPRPLQFTREKFEESIRDPKFILNTLRLDSPSEEIIGFAKGGPLESYELRPEIRDENYGLNNTVFLEPLALKMGYWGMRGGSEMRHMFIMQSHSMKYKYLTSFALRDVIRKRIEAREDAEFVTLFDPERWDYYRISI